MNVFEGKDVRKLCEVVRGMTNRNLPQFGGLKHPIRINSRILAKILMLNDLKPPRIRLVKNSKFIDPRSMVIKGKNAQLMNRWPDIEEHILNGYTLIIDNIADMYSPISEVCALLSKSSAIRCGANLYVSYRNEIAFGPHIDDHDVLALQCFGRKLWDFSEETRMIASLRYFENKEGDGLFVPAGVKHDVRSLNSWSFHVSIAIN